MAGQIHSLRECDKDGALCIGRQARWMMKEVVSHFVTDP